MAFLKTKWFDGKKIHSYNDKTRDKKDDAGQWAVYKVGGFSADMTEENKHKDFGWHMMNFKNRKDADWYSLLENMSLQWSNDGGGYYIVKKDDKSTVPAMSSEKNK